MVFALVALSAAVVLLCGAWFRVSRNLRPGNLEDYAAQNGVVFVPVARDLIAELQTWSKPVRVRLDNHRHPLLAELIFTDRLEDPPDA